VYLQQNSFDPVDAAVSVERQTRTFTLLFKILCAQFKFSDKKEIRQYFNALRQNLLDWNNILFDDPSFVTKEEEIKAQYEKASTGFDKTGEKLM
jgi:V/A-type H+-transporting ATPase subunit A